MHLLCACMYMLHVQGHLRSPSASWLKSKSNPQAGFKDSLVTLSHLLKGTLKQIMNVAWTLFWILCFCSNWGSRSWWNRDYWAVTDGLVKDSERWDHGQPLCCLCRWLHTHTYIHIYRSWLGAPHDSSCLTGEWNISPHVCMHFPRRLYTPPPKYLFVFPIQPRWWQWSAQSREEEELQWQHHQRSLQLWREEHFQPRMEMSLQKRNGKEAWLNSKTL